MARGLVPGFASFNRLMRFDKERISASTSLNGSWGEGDLAEELAVRRDAPVI
jgi:hypothetical protein